MHTTLALATVMLMGGQPGSDVASPAGVVHLNHCVVSLIDQVQVPAEEEGVIVEIIAKELTEVRQGDVLVQLDDSEAQMQRKAAELEHKVAIEQATNRVNIEAAKAAQEVAEAEVAESKAINLRSPGSVPETQIRREELTAKRAKMQVEVAEFELKIAGMESQVKAVQVEAMDAEIQRRKVDAAQDGVVAQVYRHVGEWVRAGDPIMRLVRMDRLRVEGFVNAAEYLPQQVMHRPVQIRVTLPTGVVMLNGRVDYYSPIVEASGEYRIWAEVENQKVNDFWVLRPGLPAEMDIYTNQVN